MLFVLHPPKTFYTNFQLVTKFWSRNSVSKHFLSSHPTVYDSELIGTMFLSLKSLINWIMITPTLMLHFKIRLISISLQFLYKIDLQTSHVYIHSTPSLLKLEGLGPVCRASGSYKRPRKRVLGQG